MSSLGSYPHHSQSHALGGVLYPSASNAPSRSRTPSAVAPQSQHALQPPESDHNADNDPRSRQFKELYARTEQKIDVLFAGELVDDADEPDLGGPESEPIRANGVKSQVKKPARSIDEDDYDDSEDEDETSSNVSPLKAKSTGSTAIPRVPSPFRISGIPPSPAPTSAHGSAPLHGKGIEDARKKLEDDKKEAEEAARKSFNTMFWPLDNDRLTMLEQQRLEESERQIDVEMSGQGHTGHNQPAGGSLSQANLGASSLVLKHLIARIDAKRELVRASDQELRNLMIEVKKNRSKWASEDKIGQEELYEAADKVLQDIKSNTEHSQPFLTKVNKKDAPDYYTIIKEPMDFGLMTKKLKSLQYKSKAEFVRDLNLIWTNCMKYNDKPGHFLLKHAEAMKRMSQRLIPLIPDIVIRDRAEVEAEERRQQVAEGDVEGADDSDDEPIISSRGRKATSKKARKGAGARKAPEAAEGTPIPEGRASLPNGTAPSIRRDFLRADSDTGMDGSQTGGLNTPPAGTLTPLGQNGATVSSQADPMDIDHFGDVHGTALGSAEIDYDDDEFKIWKQVTKKDRAVVTAERNRLFKGDKLNPEEPALVRSRPGMRRWLRRQRESDGSTVLGKRKRSIADDAEGEQGNETLAEGLEENEERILPDYYDVMSAIPDIDKNLQWKEDSEGFVVPGCDETLRMIPKGYFTAPFGTMSTKMTSNMRQMQETRRICAKIGIVKQMQLQSQMYQNQFQKYDPDPLIDQDVEPHVVSDDGPVMAGYVCRAAMQRSVAKIFFNTGFEEYQPSALDAMADIATDFMVKLGQTLSEYLTRPRIPVAEPVPGSSTTKVAWKRKYSMEESILLALNESGIELEGLETYAKDDSERFGNKLTTMHERMKAHLSELLRPALASDAGPDGVNAFNDGSEQFVGGDFAEDLGEDFFGFKELGLDKEFGLAGLSVPLHLLQNRMHSAYQAQNNNVTTSAVATFPTPPPVEPVTIESIPNEVGLVQNFFRAKLHANNDSPLVEDEELPQKQRLPKPRLPPNGKITSPRKRPVREAGPGKGHPKKKMRLIEGQGWVKESDLIERERQEKEEKEKVTKPVQPQQTQGGSKLKNSVSAMDLDDRDANGDDEEMVNGVEAVKGKEKVVPNGTMGEGGMISPESLEAT